MTDYKTMYTTLFNKISDIVNELQQIQKETEEMFISSEEEGGVISILPKECKSK
ncbi:hypothetical protein [Clostridium aminobutyricum]|uniref:Uncharacterized protein n=1 Tax=Clostridium aminobutyricum TaxID=33953 RepID=A0A939IGQ9_CLOAM|nr:hypothetical protein [Clostridium aminobutyricum]MBN7772332.1 hypothetical protein [Clostridium aminobutyricum]